MRPPILRQGSRPPKPRHANDPGRPIAVSLPLGAGHGDRTDPFHEHGVALGVSRLERPAFGSLGRLDLTAARDRDGRLRAHAAPVAGDRIALAARDARMAFDGMEFEL